jgi:intracellular septation protein
MSQTSIDTTEKQLGPRLKLLLELGPLLIFLFANQRAGILTGTAVFVAATTVALVVHYALIRKLPIMPLVSGIGVIFFGGLTLIINDELFIKLKPTIVNSLFGLILLGGLYFNKPFLATVLGSVLKMTDEGWHKLTLRWALFFFFLAGVNEFVWRTQTTDFWVGFKVFGFMPITIAFMLAQTRLIQRHSLDGEAGS